VGCYPGGPRDREKRQGNIDVDDPDAKQMSYREAPADHITIACFTYIARVMEARKFDRFFFGVVAASASFANGMTPESKAEFEEAVANYRFDPHRFAPHHQFINELLLARAIESFDLYLLHILRLIFSLHPELIIDPSRFEAELAKSELEPDDFLHSLAERKLHELGNSDLAQLRSYFEKELGIALFKDRADYANALLASRVRNLIAHNDGRVNRIFLKKTSGLPMKPKPEFGKRYVVSTDWLHDLCSALDSVVFNFDEVSIGQFALPTFNRFGSFLLRD
jgi:hypothetical protein